MEFNRVNAYRVMWLFVFFDLPTGTKKQRHDASCFRKMLEKEGFEMMQFSVYIRHCASRENMEMHMRRVELMLPEQGYVSMTPITDRQFSEIRNFWNQKTSSLVANNPSLIEFF